MDRRIKNLLLAALCLTILLAPISFMGNPVEANDHDNIDLKKFNIEQVSFTKGEMKTREASVKVYNEAGGHGSGAYFLYKGHHVIFTAAHVASKGELFLILDQWGNRRLGTVVYMDQEIDFAIILIPGFEKTKPLKLKLPKYSPLDKMGKSLIFSGFPSEQHLTTVRGIVSGIEGRYFVMQSTAWRGSSGSCVFDGKGNFVGILFAVSVSEFYGNPVLLGSLVWVEPYSGINWDAAEEALDSIN